MNNSCGVCMCIVNSCIHSNYWSRTSYRTYNKLYPIWIAHPKHRCLTWKMEWSREGIKELYILDSNDKRSANDISLQCTGTHIYYISIDQSHRYGRPQAACREPAGSYDNTTRTAICFEHKTQYLLIRAPYSRIVVFWRISNIPPMISQSQISCNPPTFYIAAIFVKYCYTTRSWLL